MAARRSSRDQSFIESNFDGEVKIRNRNLARNANGDLMAMARNVAMVITDRSGAERAVHRVQYGARLKVDEGDKIKRGQRIAEWDPFTRPILTEVDGVIGFEDLVEGVSMSEQVDEATGIAKRIVTDWRSAPRTATLKPALVIKGKDGKLAKLPRGGDARYLLPVELDHSFEPGATVRAGDVSSRASRSIAPRRATSPAVCRGWRNCSRLAVPRITRSSPRFRGRCSSAGTSKTSSG